MNWVLVYQSKRDILKHISQVCRDVFRAAVNSKTACSWGCFYGIVNQLLENASLSTPEQHCTLTDQSCSGAVIQRNSIYLGRSFKYMTGDDNQALLKFVFYVVVSDV